MARKYPIPVSAGGQLLTQPAFSLENVGDANYSLKINFRRSEDQEIRREGWVKFQPSAGDPVAQQYIFDGVQQLNRLAELVAGNGDRVIVGASATTIKAFNPNTFTWQTIGQGYSPVGSRWQTEAIGGYLVLNNAVDLPCYYLVGNAAVTPMYELRDVGVASVGRISQLNGFLFCLNIVEIDSNQLNTFMTGYANYVPGFNVNENNNFAWNGADSTTQYNITTANAIITVGASAVQPLPTWWILLKKVDAGPGSVVTLPVLSDQTVSLVNQGDMALIWSDGSNYYAKNFPGGVIPQTTPYGRVPLDILNSIPYRVTWSTPGVPSDWAPQYRCYQPASSKNITLPFATLALHVGDLVAVVGGGPNGGTLGGQSNYPNGVPITAINGSVITLAEPTDAGLAYPIFVTVLRFKDIGTVVGYYDLQGDGSAIIGAAPLQGRLQIYKDGSIFIGTYIAVSGSPFSFVEKYTGDNVPIYGDAIVSLNGQSHVYPGYGGRFYIWDGITYPTIHEPTDDARDLLFNNLANEAVVWAFDNQLTKELWFCRPGLVMAFDYLKNTVSEIDTQIDAAVFCTKPGDSDKWVVLGIDQPNGGSNVYTYALVQGLIPITTWLRDGQPAVPQITSGLIQAGNETDEKMLLEYTPLQSSNSPDMQMTFQIYTTYNPNGVLSAQFVDVNGNPDPVTLPDPAGNNYIPCAFQAIYFQDEIAMTDTRDLDCRISARILRFQDVRAGSVTRTSN
jgi:hypothetical protein